jgi:hypothetical protein
MGRVHSMVRKALVGLAVVAALISSPVIAATLYITEYASLGAAGSNMTPYPPGQALDTQAIAISGSSAQSAAFGSTTRVVLLTCDEGCSVVFSTDPTATTDDTLLQQGVPYIFAVVPGQEVAAISNPAGDTPGGGGAATDVEITGPLGQEAMADSIPVVVASNQSAIDVGTGTAGTADASVVTVQGIAAMTPIASSQSGTWTVQPGNTQNTTPWLVQEGPYSYSRQTADGQVKATAGYVHTVTISPTGAVTAGVLTLYDSATETGTVIMSIALPVTTFTPFSVELDATAGTGLFVGFDGTLANVQATVTYR